MPSPSEDLLEEPIAESPDFAESSPPSWRSVLMGGLGSLLLLAIGGSVAGILGIIVAINSPSQNSGKPPLIWVWEQLPWGDRQPFDNSLSPEETAIPESEVNPEFAAREQLEAEITNLGRQLQGFRDRLAQLETQLEISPATDAPLEARVLALQQKLETLPPPPPAAVSPVVPSAGSSLPGDKLKITLPVDFLFGNNNDLSDSGRLLLDTIITDLSEYEGATIRIAAHTNSANMPEANRELSFQLARTVENYIRPSLRNYRWVAIGYGQTRPLVPDTTETNRKRNRRVEIAVD